MDIKFNINNKVKVKLTPSGILYWIHHNNSYMLIEYQLTYQQILDKKTEDGYWEFQLHDLMSIFGNLMFNGNMDLPFETDIVIPVKLDRKNKIEKIIKENE